MRKLDPASHPVKHRFSGASDRRHVRSRLRIPVKPFHAFLWILCIASAVRPVGAQTLRIYHIDVEQGDATLIVSPSGRTLLVDAGRSGTGNRILVAMEQAGVTQIDHFVATHYHSDHYGAVAELVAGRSATFFSAYDRGEKGDRGPIGMLEGSVTAQRTFVGYQEALGMRAQGVRPGDAIPLDPEMTVIVITSGGFVLGDEDAGVPAGENDASVSLLIQYGAFRYFLGADLETPTADRIAAQDVVNEVDVYRAAHHGSATGGSAALLADLSPRVVVISNGNSPAFRHPRQETLDRYNALPAAPTVFQTNKLMAPGNGGGNVADEFIGDPFTDGPGSAVLVTVDRTSGTYDVSFRDRSYEFAVKPPPRTALGDERPNVREAEAFALRRVTGFRPGPTPRRGVDPTTTVVDPPADREPDPGFFSEVRDFMGWRWPQETAAFLKGTVPINLLALSVFYALAIFAVWVVSPWRCVAWHELLARSGAGMGHRIAKVLVPVLVTSHRCLAAFVSQHSDRARTLFFDEEPNVRARGAWVPAPMEIEGARVAASGLRKSDELGQPFTEGIEALRKSFGPDRWLIVIEGAGGIGKSSLAFEIARRASDGRREHRLADRRMLPVYVSDLSEDLDVEVRARLEHLAGVTALSDRLVEALLIGKHVLVVVDGLSEMSERALDAVKPHGGSKLSRAVVITTRVPPQLPDSHAVRPLLVGREDMGDMVDRFIAKKYGRGRFTEGQTEVIVSSLRRLIHASGGSDRLSRAVPMIFVELMLKQAHLRADDGAGLESLPTSSVGLFEQYTLDVLRSTANREQSVDDARIAAQVCLAPDYVPKLRSRKAFDEAGLSRKAVDELIASGLMTRVGTDVDPRFRFTLDPVAEYLAAKWEVIVARHDERAQAELSALLSRLEEQGGEARSEGFIAALKECLALEDAVDG